MKAPPLAARTVGIALAILLLARVLAMFSPTMWAWGLNVPRFLAPTIAWSGLALMAIVFAPPVALTMGRATRALGDQVTTSPAARVVTALLGGALVWLLADRLWFLGDFMLRQGAIEGAGMETIFQQALPLDVLVHALVPRVFAADPAAIGSVYSRLLGAVEAGLLAVLALRFARTLELTGAAALAAAGIVFFGGHLAFFTGFAKPAGELSLFTVATLVFGASLARDGKSGYALGVTLALAFGLHRSALMLLPAWLLAFGVWFARHRGGSRRISGLMALLLPAVMLTRALPQIVRIAREFDLSRHVLPAEVMGAGGPLLAAIQPLRLLDLLNLGLVLAPVGVVGLFWLGSSSRRGSIELKLLAAMALGALPFLLIHPQQGVFRDWDVFAPAGTALCLLAALAAGEVMRDRGADWLLAPILASAVVPTLLVLFLHHDVDLGFRRARAFVVEAPARTPREQAFVWDYLGNRAFRLGRWSVAAEAYANDERFQPTRRVRLTWALSETMLGHHAAAETLYAKMAATDPRDPIAWLGLGGAAKRTGDSLTFRRAAARLDAFLRLPAAAKEIRKYLTYYPQAWPADSIAVDSLR